MDTRRAVAGPGLDATRYAGKSEAAVLDGYLRQVRLWRHTQQPRGFRQTDLEILVAILGTDAETIDRKLRALTGCSRGTAVAFRKAFLVALVCSSALFVEHGVAAAAASSPAAASPATTSAAATPGASPSSTAAVPAATTPSAGVAVACDTTGSAPAAQATDPASATATSGGVRVTFTVPPTVDVHLDSAGKPDAVRTNTGNAPDCASAWSATTSMSGPAAPLSDLALVNRVVASAAADAALPAAGDWTPGTWYGLTN